MKTLLLLLLILTGCQSKTDSREEGQSPQPVDLRAQLLRAAAYGDTAKIEALVASGVDINLELDPKQNGLNAVKVSLVQGQFSVAKLLIRHGANLQSTYEDVSAKEIIQHLLPDQKAEQSLLGELP